MSKTTSENAKNAAKDYSIDSLIRVAIALSAEKNTSKVLDMILQVAMKISNCDAGTVYVVEDEHLVFHNSYTYAQAQGMLDDTGKENAAAGKTDDTGKKAAAGNTADQKKRGAASEKSSGNSSNSDSDSSKPKLPPVPLSREYVSACAVLDRKKINIADVYESTEYDFSGAMKYDKMTGYRTTSMLVIPMEDDRGDIIGVLQLINALDKDGNVVAFPAEEEDIISALSSLSAVILTNRRLSQQVLDTLHSFVRVMVGAIDTRSAYNANHTKNMVSYADKFLDYIAAHGDSRPLTDEERDSYLMSVWLHDIGKLVIPLEIMDKPDRLGKLHDRIKSRVTVACLMEEITGLKEPSKKPESDDNIKKIQDAWTLIEESNSKGFLPDDVIDALKAAATLTCRDAEGKEISLLTDEELTAITVRKGTLTDDERAQMQSHVVHTKKMLDQMDFRGLYANVPRWSGGHHELLDGSGYPDHLTAKDIPKEIRFLTIIDVYDALTADDRPYKPPMPPEKAFGILESMANEGKIDADILREFKESNAWVKEKKQTEN